MRCEWSASHLAMYTPALPFSQQRFLSLNDCNGLKLTATCMHVSLLVPCFKFLVLTILYRQPCTCFWVVLRTCWHAWTAYQVGFVVSGLSESVPAYYPVQVAWCSPLTHVSDFGGWAEARLLYPGFSSAKCNTFLFFYAQVYMTSVLPSLEHCFSVSMGQRDASH